MPDYDDRFGWWWGESWDEEFNFALAETEVDEETDFRQHVEDELEQCLEDIKEAVNRHTLTTLAMKLETTARVSRELAAECRRMAPDSDVSTPSSALSVPLP